MPLILAIESDRRQAARISALTRDRLANVDLIVAPSAEDAIQALARSTPDLILTPQLMSPKDEAALDERLRQLDAAGSHVQTLMIPVLASSGKRAAKKDGLLNRFRRTKEQPAEDEGCDPGVFAAQIQEYLDRRAADRPAEATRDASLDLDAIPEMGPIEDPVEAPAAAEAAPQASAGEHEPLPWLSLTEAWPAPATGGTPPVAPESEDISWSGIDDPLPALDETPAPQAASVSETPTTTVDVSSFLDAMEPAVPAAVAEPERGLWEILELDDLTTSEEVLRQAAPVGFDPNAPVDFDEAAVAAAPQSDLYAEFVSFDELSVVDLPPATLGELVEISDGLEQTAAAPINFEGIQELDEIESVEVDAISDDMEQAEAPRAAVAPASRTKSRTKGKKAPAARSQDVKPPQDEWGFFDPGQCGFEALRAKLDEPERSTAEEEETEKVAR